MEQKSRHTPDTAVETYPDITVEGRNIYYAQMLMQDLSSAAGESSAIHQYLYQSWIVEKKDADLAQELRQIAFVEMHHYNILGQLICLLGGDPRLAAYNQGRLFYWNGRMIHYANQIHSLLRDNIQAERTAATHYREQAKRVTDQSLAAVLNRIAQDEEAHMATFKKCGAERFFASSKKENNQGRF